MRESHKYSIYRDYYIDYSYQTGGWRKKRNWGKLIGIV